MVSEGFRYSHYLDFGKNMQTITMEAIAMGSEIPRLHKLLHSRLVTKVVKSSGLWYGFKGRVEWCACFVSWCGDQCGYIKAGAMRKFWCVPDGINWFKSHHRWQSRGYTPAAGDIIFFDWGGNGTQAHVGLEEKVDGRYVYTIEGNNGNAVRRQKYRVGYYEIYGYGVPNY